MTGPFAKIPEAVLFDPRLSSHAKVVYGVLDRHGSECWPSQARIGELAGLSVTRVYRAIRELVAAGHVEAIRRGRTATNLYRVIGPQRESLGGVIGPQRESDRSPARRVIGPQRERNESNRTRATEREGAPDSFTDRFAAHITTPPQRLDEGEIDAIVNELLDDLGADALTQALKGINGDRYRYPRQLATRIRARASLTPAQPPPACDVCSDVPIDPPCSEPVHQGQP
jgi:Helix-turn-helix domain